MANKKFFYFFFWWMWMACTLPVNDDIVVCCLVDQTWIFQLADFKLNEMKWIEGWWLRFSVQLFSLQTNFILNNNKNPLTCCCCCCIFSFQQKTKIWRPTPPWRQRKKLPHHFKWPLPPLIPLPLCRIWSLHFFRNYFFFLVISIQITQYYYYYDNDDNGHWMDCFLSLSLKIQTTTTTTENQ